MDAYAGDDSAVDLAPDLPPTTEPRAAFRCLYGMAHGAQATFTLPIQHGAKVYLGSKGPPRPASKYATASAETRVVLTNSNSHGISKDAGWLQYDQHKGVVFVNLQREEFPLFVNGALRREAETVLSHRCEIGFGGTSRDRVTETTIRYEATLENLPALLPPPAALGKRGVCEQPREGAAAAKRQLQGEPSPSFESDVERRRCAEALDIVHGGYMGMRDAVKGPSQGSRMELIRRVNSEMQRLMRQLLSDAALEMQGHAEGMQDSQAEAPQGSQMQSQGSQLEEWAYGEVTQAINADLCEMEQQDPQRPMTNRDVRQYARSKYQEAGFSEERIAWHMQHRSAGHIVAKSRGGGEVVGNKMWEDARANNEHGARPVNGKAVARAGRR